MNKLFLSCCFTAISIIANGQGSEESKAFYSRAMSEINSKHVQWIKTQAANVDLSPEGIKNMQAASKRYLEASKAGAVDPNALVQLVLRESYIQTTEDLKLYAEKVKYFNECKKRLREYLQELREYDTKTSASDFRSRYDSIKAFSSSIKLDMNPPSSPIINRTIIKDSRTVRSINQPFNQAQVIKPVSQEEVTALINELEQKGALLDQTSEEASFRIQQLLEEARKADSMASNIIKHSAESANAIIANLK